MPKINCSVENCSYNEEKICRASIVNVAGKGSNITESTCCATFLNRLGYRNLSLNHGTTRGDTDAILCEVNTCAYNKNAHCSLQEIEVSSLNEAENYTETDCLSFERK